VTDQALLVNAVTGYRSFTVRGGGRIFSQYSGVEWPSFPGVTFRARCELGRYFSLMASSTVLKPVGEHEPLELDTSLMEEHEAPHRDCACGIHGYYDPGSVTAATVPWEGGEPVFGLIAGWGQVIPHPDGFRCSHARICALAGTSKEARAAALNCGVLLVERRSELADVAERFGQPMPEQLIPKPVPSVRSAEHLVGGIT
jgi:hypothetical protein